MSLEEQARQLVEGMVSLHPTAEMVNASIELKNILTALDECEEVQPSELIAMAQRDRYRQALEWYGEEASYEWHNGNMPVIDDNGKRAREALHDTENV